MAKATAKKTATKKTAGKTTAAKKTAGKKTAAKKTAVKKTAGKKVAAKKTAGKKTAAKKTSAKKTSAKKSSGSGKKSSSSKKATKPKVKRKPNAAFMRPMTATAELQAVIGAKPLPRTEITKKIWDYIKKNGLQDATVRTQINADDNLKKIFGGKKSVSMFEMTKLVNGHIS